MRLAPNRPRAIVLAGPNGAGKTTAAPSLLRDELKLGVYLNADVIAQGLSGFAPEAAAREAGRVMLRRLAELQTARQSFAFESTLAGRGHVHRLRRVMQAGYEVQLFYLWLPSPELAVERVSLRVRHGGHDVPNDVVRRRYRRSLENFMRLYAPLASGWRVYDASTGLNSTGPPLVARGEGERVLEIRDPGLWWRIRPQMQSLKDAHDEPGYTPVEKEEAEEDEEARYERALRRAFQAAIRLHRMHGVPMALWIDEEVRCVDPWEIRLPDDPPREGD